MIFIILAGALLVGGDLVLRLWLDKGYRILYFAGLLQYFAAMTLLVQSYRTHHIALASVIMTILNASVVTLILWRFFGDTISVKQMVGLALAVIGIILIELG